MKSLKKEAKGKKIAGSEVENRSAAVTGGPKNSNVNDEGAIKCRVVLNSSQKKSIEIRADFEKKGEILSDSEVRMIKKEGKLVRNINSASQTVHYFKTLEERTGKRGMQIILMAVIWVIKAKCPMPEQNPRAYWLKSVNLAQRQTDNLQGYFLPAFGGLATMIASNTAMLTAIEHFEADNGTGSTEAIAAAQAIVKISVDKLIIYVNDLCIADQANSLAFIESAGMLPVKQKAKNTKPDFSITKVHQAKLFLFHWQEKLMTSEFRQLITGNIV